MASTQVSYLQKADVMLNDKNYKAWSSTLRVLLRGLNLWGHVDGTRPPPCSSSAVSSSSSSSTVTSASSSTYADLLKWTKDDARTIAIICQSCELHIRLATLTFTYRRETSVSDFFAVLSDLWRQCDEMTPSPSPTCAQCLAIAQYRDYLHIYEFLMRLRPEFEAVRAQLLHWVTPPSASDTLAYVLDEEILLRSLNVVPPPDAPHYVLAAPQ
ncbi:uncharacterized protein LOC120261408 [Dioscorea cayenensis subsp. rotundata]|uniref:Uncharacterized protein LOC120261408 n=1 Tax=Dioscorea cayennensis subsp. rotundata TaxID=55577 RepID=A0AB40BF86_DIOCR|nr:uncharacterized protein LOC120261408 [Dioscorea cayenensis subsp. rotundata]